MSQTQHLIALIDAYAKARGLSHSRVSTIIFSSGSKYEQLVAGADLTVGRLEAAVRWLSENWPEDTDWPEGIARPLKSEAA